MRMKLHKTSRFGDYEIYPIYEIDYNSLSALSGFTVQQTNDNVQGYKYRRIFCANNSVGGAIQVNIPRTDEQDGNIIPFTHKYNNQRLDTRYYLPENVMESFEYVPIGQQPDDWGSNPNYVEFSYPSTTYDGHLVSYPACIRLDESFSSSAQYYKDTKRTQLRMFYTDSGNHFTVSKGAYYNDNRPCGTTVILGGFPAYHFGSSSQAIYYKPYYFGTDSDMLSYDYYSFDNWGITNIPSNADYLWSMWNVGVNVVTVFIHCIINGVDFYGTAAIQFSSWDTETNEPAAIRAILLDSSFWGNSIISGGESGVGEWGNPAIPNVNDGTFSSTSNSVGTDNPNYSTTAIQTRVNTALGGLFSGLTGVYSIYLLDTADGQSVSFTELTRIYNVLYASGNDKFLTRYLQSMYNPLSAVIAMHLIPYQFTASALFGATVKKQLTISGYNVSAAISETNPPEYNILKPLGRVVFPRLDMPKYFGGFADFAPYTQCILHLPFIGAIELKTNAIAHGAITVEYLCDMISGNVTARISCTDNTGENTQYVHTASGNCAYNLPLFTMNQNGDAVGKLLSGGAGIVSGALTGNPVNVATGVAGVVGAAIESSFSPRSTQISGNMGGNNMLMSNLDIWLEIVRPVWVENMYYQKLNGIPANMSNCIADCGQDASAGVAYDGFLQIETIDLDNVPCTEQEKQEIETLLKQGVFIRGSEI